MTHAPQDNATEQRRRLLKGALGASTVVTLGYGAPAAAASLACVANVRTDGGYPTAAFQFTTQEPSTTSGVNWAWQPLEIDVHRYKGKLTSSSRNEWFEGFEFNGKVYPTLATRQPTPVFQVNPAHPPQLTGKKQTAWVLAYFKDDGTPAGAYPQYDTADQGATPAAQSCLASINPNSATGLTFGG